MPASRELEPLNNLTVTGNHRESELLAPMTAAEGGQRQLAVPQVEAGMVGPFEFHN